MIIKSNQIKSNQIKSNQIKSNQIKSNICLKHTYRKLNILKYIYETWDGGPPIIKFNSLCFMYKYDDRENIPLSFKHFFTPFSRDNRSERYILYVSLKKKLHIFPSYTLPISFTIKRISTFNNFKKYLKKRYLRFI